VRYVNEHARDLARRKIKTKAFFKSRNQRKKVEMPHLKTHHGFGRLRLRGLSGARDEFHLAAIVQNLEKQWRFENLRFDNPSTRSTKTT
jgi:hypothetical protein